MMTKTSLEELRQEIDRIDDAMHDLLIARAAIVEQIGIRKGATATPVMHPGREAAILRRLAARHHGPLPFVVVARIWRELIGAFTHLQAPFAVVTYAPEEQPDAWDLARDYYGSRVPMTAYRTIGQVIRSVNDQSAAIGVLPMPLDHDDDPWWRHLLSRDAQAPRVLARLPFAGRGNCRGDRDVLVIARGNRDPLGFDRSFIGIEVPGDLSRARLLACLTQAGLSCGLLSLWSREGLSLAFAEIAGSVPPGDARLADLAAQLGEPIDRFYHLGGYADPLSSQAASL